VVMLASVAPGFAQEEPVDDSLRVYAVNIIRTPPQEWTGYGIYLGRGLVLTAAHVVGSAARTRPNVRIAGLVLPATAVKEGELDKIDLTLLEVDEEQLPISLRLRRLPICQRPPWVGEPVVVVVPEGTARSRIMSPQRLPAQYRARFPTVISDVATTGNSGSGVFDAAAKCLLGIMSQKIMVRANPESEFKDLAKYFVPAETISAFIPASIPSAEKLGEHDSPPADSAASGVVSWLRQLFVK
jgi:S1-C subfamily serine protease